MKSFKYPIKVKGEVLAEVISSLYSSIYKVKKFSFSIEDEMDHATILFG
ncbi:hypothetical protein [Paraliobacillus zengyii]|nr:hypothetical protein [Paraliobacillus zengyii]